MATAQDYLSQIEAFGDLPDYQRVIAQSYEDPVIRPLTEEAAGLESQYLPTIFESLAGAGTGAADMSSGAKLANIGSTLGRLGSRVSANRSVQDFYKTQVQDLAGYQQQKWQSQYGKLWDLYNAQQQAEQQAAARAAAMQQSSFWEDFVNSLNIEVEEEGQAPSRAGGFAPVGAGFQRAASSRTPAGAGMARMAENIPAWMRAQQQAVGALPSPFGSYASNRF